MKIIITLAAISSLLCSTTVHAEDNDFTDADKFAAKVGYSFLAKKQVYEKLYGEATFGKYNIQFTGQYAIQCGFVDTHNEHLRYVTVINRENGKMVTHFDHSYLKFNDIWVDCKP